MHEGEAKKHSPKPQHQHRNVIFAEELEDEIEGHPIILSCVTGCLCTFIQWTLENTSMFRPLIRCLFLIRLPFASPSTDLVLPRHPLSSSIPMPCCPLPALVAVHSPGAYWCLLFVFQCTDGVSTVCVQPYRTVGYGWTIHMLIRTCQYCMFRRVNTDCGSC